MSRSHPQIHMRLPEQLKEWLEKQAARNFRSVTAEITVAIRERMDRETSANAAGAK